MIAMFINVGYNEREKFIERMKTMYNFMLAGLDATAWGTIIMLVVCVVAFYFFLIRPQRKQEKEAAAMRNNLHVGDEITTIGGVIGQIVSMKDETITIETSKDRTKIRFLKSAVRSVDVKAEDAQD